MLSVINSTRCANVNNYKNACRNTSQNAVGYQQSFSAARPAKATSMLLGLVIAAIEAVSPAKVAKAEEAITKLADKATGAAVLTVKKAAGKKHGGKIRNLQAFVDSLRGKKEVLVDDLLEAFGKQAEEAKNNPSDTFYMPFYGKNGASIGYYDRKPKTTTIAISTNKGSVIYFDYNNDRKIDKIIYGFGKGGPEIEIRNDIPDPYSN